MNTRRAAWSQNRRRTYCRHGGEKILTEEMQWRPWTRLFLSCWCRWWECLASYRVLTTTIRSTLLYIRPTSSFQQFRLSTAANHAAARLGCLFISSPVNNVWITCWDTCATRETVIWSDICCHDNVMVGWNRMLMMLRSGPSKVFSVKGQTQLFFLP